MQNRWKQTIPPLTTSNLQHVREYKSTYGCESGFNFLRRPMIGAVTQQITITITTNATAAAAPPATSPIYANESVVTEKFQNFVKS